MAAGLGERLRPITGHIPKPLLPVIGKPVLESVLEKVSALPAAAIGVNLHYRKELIERWIRNSVFSDKVTLFPEDPVLGTGGALKNAEEFLKDGPFLVHNADILSDVDLERLLIFHNASGNIATLAVHEYPEFNNLVLDENGYLIEVGALCSLCREPTSRLLAFTGIAVYTPEFLKFLPEGASSVIHAWTQAISSGQRIGTYEATACSWTDIGTPASYAKAVFNELRRNGETVYVHPSTTWCGRVQLDGHVVIEKESSCDQETCLKNCIVLPGTEIGGQNAADTSHECFLTLFWGAGNDAGNQKKRSFENCILGPGFEIGLAESDLFGSTGDSAVLIGQGGSDRKYYRVRKDSGSAVLMQCSRDDQDFQRHIEYTRFFQKYLIPVPELVDADTANKSALFEDMGDISLYSWRKCPRSGEELEEIYKRVMDILVLIHTTATARIAECSLLSDRIFDYAHLRWETGYFIERFVQAVRNMNAGSSALEDDFHRLATVVDSFPKTIIHRDFQSQNIMVTQGKVPRMLDFQGARIGPPGYDIASILWDPYARIDDALRESILDYYFSAAILRDRSLKKDDFRKTLVPCRIQRHMQALGAYGFLAMAKGKKYFLKHIPEALRLLKEDIAVTRDEYPALHELIRYL